MPSRQAIRLPEEIRSAEFSVRSRENEKTKRSEVLAAFVPLLAASIAVAQPQADTQPPHFLITGYLFFAQDDFAVAYELVV